MVVAYLDNGHIVDAAVVRALCQELGASAAVDFEMTPLHKGGGSKYLLSRECNLCGAPLGQNDPDESKYVILSVCSDCRC